MALTEIAINALNNTITILITLFLGLLTGKLANKLVRRITAEIEINRILKKEHLDLEKYASNVAEYGIYTLTLLIILQQLGLTTIVLAIIGTIIAATIIFSIILAAKDYVPNIIAGIYVKQKLKQQQNKKVKIGTVEGTLKHIGLAESIIEEKEKHYVPHAYTKQNKIKQTRAN